MMNSRCRLRETALSLVCWFLFSGIASGLEPDQVSRTAIGVACARALMARADDPVVKNPDYLAERLLDEELKSLNESCADLDRPFAEAYADRTRGPAAFNTLGMVVRTRHIDEALQDALADGMEQVVILGAGLDTRAYRFHDGHPAAHFFEVDSPATQSDKRERVERVFGTTPEHVTFVPVDFETQSLAEELAAAGFDASARTFYVWEGVTMYLTADAIDATLEFVTEHSAPGSEIVFDYVYKELIDGTFPEPSSDAGTAAGATDAVGRAMAVRHSAGADAGFSRRARIRDGFGFSGRRTLCGVLGAGGDRAHSDAQPGVRDGRGARAGVGRTDLLWPCFGVERNAVGLR